MNAPKFTTQGCRLNAYETEAMKELARAGWFGQYCCGEYLCGNGRGRA